MTMQQTPSQVLDLVGRWRAELSNPDAEYVNSCVYAVMRAGKSRYVATFKEGTAAIQDEEQLAKGNEIFQNLTSLMTGAHLYHVQSDMTDLVLAAATGLDDQTKWRTDFLPTQVGFAYFDAPIILTDPNGGELKVHAFVWGPGQYEGRTVTMLHPLHDIRDPDAGDQRADEILGEANDRSDGVLNPVGLETLHLEESLGPPYIPSEVTRVDEDPETDSISHEFLNLKRVFVAYIKLLNQTLVRSAPAKIDRHAEKRARRRGIDPAITTVQLRRVQYTGEPPNDDSHPVDWHYSWIVRGHWRWQPCGPNHPLAEPDEHGGFHAHLYINPHLKGPPDKPLKVSEKLYDLSR